MTIKINKKPSVERVVNRRLNVVNLQNYFWICDQTRERI